MISGGNYVRNNQIPFYKRKNRLKDCKNNELNIGDEVVYIRGKNSGASLDVGKITKFYKGYFGEDECSVGSQTHIIESRIMKL